MKTRVALVIAAALWHLEARAGSIILRSLGGTPAPFGSMALSLAGADDAPTGAVILTCPPPVFSGSLNWITTCTISREDLARGFVGPPEGRRMVGRAGRSSCSATFPVE